jgi:hypothetical protein
LSIMEELGAWAAPARARGAIVLANLQRGAFDEAELGLEQLARDGGQDAVGLLMFDVCAHAEIRIGRGDVDGGLRLWREAADRLRTAGRGLWALEVQAVAVVVHAQHGRLELVTDITGTLPGILSAMVGSAPVVDFPACGSLLLALAVTDLDRGVAAPGVRMIVLAQRFGVQRGFQPAMSTTRIREIAEHADRAAYAEAVSAYAGLDHEGLRAAALAALRDRGLAGSSSGLAGSDSGLSGSDLGLSGSDLGLSGSDLGLSGSDLGLSGSDLG